MVVFDQQTTNRGRKAKVGNIVITDSSQVAFFVAYCDCGCNAKICVTADTAREFSKRFYRQHEPVFFKLIASPLRGLGYLSRLFQNAHQLTKDQSEL
jgi:hypothetical protein